MAIKILRDKKIFVRATDKDVAILKTLTTKLNLSQGEVVSLALENLMKIKEIKGANENEND